MATIKFLEGVEVPGVSEFQQPTATDPTLYIDAVNNKVGFRTDTPESAFDVNGTMRLRNELNVGATTEQNLFVAGGTGGQYVKMGNYGSGNYFGVNTNTNQPKYTASFGSAGKVVEDSRIVTIKITGNGWSNLNTTPATLVAAPGENKIIIPREVLIYRDTASSPGTGWPTTGNIGAWIGNSNGGVIAEFFQIPRTVCSQSGTWFWAAPGPLPQEGSFATNWGTSYDKNKAILFGTLTKVSSAPDWYIQIRYSTINLSAGITANVDTTIS